MEVSLGDTNCSYLDFERCVRPSRSAVDGIARRLCFTRQILMQPIQAMHQTGLQSFGFCPILELMVAIWQATMLRLIVIVKKSVCKNWLASGYNHFWSNWMVRRVSFFNELKNGINLYTVSDGEPVILRQRQLCRGRNIHSVHRGSNRNKLLRSEN